jgi:hypothetical protein
MAVLVVFDDGQAADNEPLSSPVYGLEAASFGPLLHRFVIFLNNKKYAVSFSNRLNRYSFHFPLHKSFLVFSLIKLHFF